MCCNTNLQICELQDEIDEKNLNANQFTHKCEMLQNRISELECNAMYHEPTTP